MRVPFHKWCVVEKNQGLARALRGERLSGLLCTLNDIGQRQCLASGRSISWVMVGGASSERSGYGRAWHWEAFLAKIDGWCIVDVSVSWRSTSGKQALEADAAWPCTLVAARNIGSTVLQMLCSDEKALFSVPFVPAHVACPPPGIWWWRQGCHVWETGAAGGGSPRTLSAAQLESDVGRSTHEQHLCFHPLAITPPSTTPKHPIPPFGHGCSLNAAVSSLLRRLFLSLLCLGSAGRCLLARSVLSLILTLASTAITATTPPSTTPSPHPIPSTTLQSWR